MMIASLLTAPMFARLPPLHSFKQMLLSHLEHCPISMDTIINTLIHWCLLIVVWHRSSPKSPGLLLWLFAHSNHHSTSAIVSQMDFHMHPQVQSFCNMLIHGNIFHSCSTPSLLESHSFFFNRLLLLGTHSMSLSSLCPVLYYCTTEPSFMCQSSRARLLS